MKNKKVLLTAFRGTSAEVLVRDKVIEAQYKVLLLPNDKEKDSQMLNEVLQQEHFDYVISLGQRPNIKDKVHIETTARKGGATIKTAFDCEALKVVFEQNGLSAKLSHNAGISFCNELYWSGLRYISENELDTRMVFVHVPFEKNIMGMDIFRTKVFYGISITMNY